MKASSVSQRDRARKFINKCLNSTDRWFLTLTQFDSLFTNTDFCTYSDKPFNGESDITIERINPKKGYEEGNVCLVTKEANQHKSHLDAFVKQDIITPALKIKLLRKALYQLEKEEKNV
ncbi:MAG: hypothetical protein ACRCVU_13790 [Flavobacterium sp.]